MKRSRSERYPAFRPVSADIRRVGEPNGRGRGAGPARRRDRLKATPNVAAHRSVWISRQRPHADRTGDTAAGANANGCGRTRVRRDAGGGEGSGDWRAQPPIPGGGCGPAPTAGWIRMWGSTWLRNEASSRGSRRCPEGRKFDSREPHETTARGREGGRRCSSLGGRLPGLRPRRTARCAGRRRASARRARRPTRPSGRP
jgi:hypothetical protein